MDTKEIIQYELKKLSDDELISTYKKHDLKMYTEEFFELCAEELKKRNIALEGLGIEKEDNQEKIIFCANCGAKIYSDSNFCPKCGKDIKQNNVSHISQEIQNTKSIGHYAFEGGVIGFICVFGGCAILGSMSEGVNGMYGGMVLGFLPALLAGCFGALIGLGIKKRV